MIGVLVGHKGWKAEVELGDGREGGEVASDDFLKREVS